MRGLRDGVPRGGGGGVKGAYVHLDNCNQTVVQKESKNMLADNRCHVLA